MSSSSKVIVVVPPGDAEARAARQVVLGLARDGVTGEIVTSDGDELALPDDIGIVVVHGSDTRAVDLVRAVRVKLDAASLDLCVVYAGSVTGAAAKTLRRDAEAAGAHEVIQFPAYLRDVVTVARVLRGHPASKRHHIVGNLAETTGVFTLVRAFASLKRSAVLTMMRGLRRGEIRFFHGEVTSAELAITHGQAAFHQLLLWTEARFELFHEDIVRRQQIPLTHDELFDDAERFLENVREASGSLSPAMVLEQDFARIQSLGKQVPTEVHGVLRMFDGHRVLADILEDSPYRVFETLRVTQRAVEVGLLRVLESHRPKATWRTVLAIEEWLTGHDRDAAVEKAHAELESGPVEVTATEQTNPMPRSLKRMERARITRNNIENPTLPRVSSRPDIDWGSLVPRVVGAEVGSLSGVVPAAQLSGEIALATRDEPRERLEAMMDTAQREKIFVLDQAVDQVAIKIADERAAVAARIAMLQAEATATTESGAPAEANIENTGARVKRQREDAEDAELRADALAAAKKVIARTTSDNFSKQALAAVAASAEAPVSEPIPVADVDDDTMWKQIAERARAAAADQMTMPIPRLDASEIEMPHEVLTPQVVIAETSSQTVTLRDAVTVAGTALTAVVTSTPVTSIHAPPSPRAGAPEPIEDEPSDGIVRAIPISNHKLVPSRGRAPIDDVPDDRPEDATGEIEMPRDSDLAPAAAIEPSILVDDLAAAHSAIAAIAPQQAAAPASGPNLATSQLERSAGTVRVDAALALSEAEEAFFKNATKEERANVSSRTGAIETFDDLDDDYQPLGFWDRVKGKRPPPGK